MSSSRIERPDSSILEMRAGDYRGDELNGRNQ
jgi:hypothetical protein